MHCYQGIGRSGVLAVSWDAIQQLKPRLKAGKSISEAEITSLVFKTTAAIRLERDDLINGQEQYGLACEVVSEYVRLFKNGWLN